MSSQHRLIYVVEDDRNIREVLAIILRSEGYIVRTAANGAEALRMLKEAPETPSLILLDLMMPVMNGYEFCEEQRADPALRKIPVIILTADGHAADKAVRVGAAGALGKPVDLDVVLDTVRDYCAGSDPVLAASPRE